MASEITSKAIDLVKDHGKGFDENNTWTIKFLADIKVVYIITYIYITVVNLISSTARSEVLSDEDCDNLYNVSSGHTNVPVKFINNAVLWSCRDQSFTKYYYKFLYWMLIIALATALAGFAATKLMALFTLCCSPKHVLTKLWHLAIISELIEKIGRDNEIVNDIADHCAITADQGPNTADQSTNTENQGVKTADQCDNTTDQGAKTENQGASTSDQGAKTENQGANTSDQGTNTENQGANTADQDANIEDQGAGIGVGTVNQQVDLVAADQQTGRTVDSTAGHQHTEKFGIQFDSKNEEFCKRLLHQDIPHEQIEKCYRQRAAMIIPILLLVLLVMTMGVSFLSYDLHPLGCLLAPDEKDIKYKNTTKSVDVQFPDKLQDFQKAAGFAAAFLAAIYLLLAWVFYLCSESVSLNLLRQGAAEHITREIGTICVLGQGRQS